ncbi:lanthionine synthetase C family protein [Streptomyces sp. NPDC003032]
MNRSSGPGADTRQRARTAVQALAAALHDPAPLGPAPGTVPPGAARHWRSSLAEGYPGTTLLFAELAHQDPAHRTTAHAHLAAAAHGLRADPGDRLFRGVPAVAFAAAAAAAEPADYARLLHRLDEHVHARLRDLVQQERTRTGLRRPGVPMAAYDVISGLAGLGRYLLLRGHHDQLADALTALIDLTRPVTVNGRRLPGWWVPHSPLFGQDAACPHGHLNLGLAHGIPGPLALLALAWDAGLRLPGHDDAVHHIATWLLAHADRNEGALAWPAVLTVDENSHIHAAGPARSHWCYGTPGVARALYLAGTALDHSAWRHTAVTALQHALTQPRPHPQPPDGLGLCHGLAGLLHTTTRLAHDSQDRLLARHLPALADDLLAAFSHPSHPPPAPASVHQEHPGRQNPPSYPVGLLDGASGIALALHSHATGQPPATAWDAALLLA